SVAPIPTRAPAEEPKATPRAPRRAGGFVTFLQGLLPKPVLFGLYGALGALLGLLVIGELVFAFVHPPKPKAEVKLSVTPELTLFPGSASELSVKIARHGFQGPVTVAVVSSEEGIQAAERVLPEDAT